MTALDHSLYTEGTEVSAAVVQESNRRATVSAQYIGPVGRGGLHLIRSDSGDTYQVPLENIRRSSN